jgi:hypothetical protein
MPYNESTQEQSSNVINIMILTSPKNSTRFIDVISLPSYSVIHRIPVAIDCFLSKSNHFIKVTPKDSSAGMYFVEGWKSSETEL